MQASQNSGFGNSQLDVLARDYWQAYLNKSAITGGMAYQKKLFECALDGSMDSLKLIDRLLLAVKNDLTSRGYPESTVMADASFQNFVQFVAFYAGRVASGALGARVSWQAGSVFAKRYPNANLAQTDFYSQMALIAEPALKALQVTPLFLLSHVGARLFGGAARPFNHPVTGAPISDSVAAAVADYVAQVQALMPAAKPAPAQAQVQPAPVQAQPAPAQRAPLQSAPVQQAAAQPQRQVQPAPLQTPVQPVPTLEPTLAPIAPADNVPTLTLIPDAPAPTAPTLSADTALAGMEIDPEFEMALASPAPIPAPAAKVQVQPQAQPQLQAQRPAQAAPTLSQPAQAQPVSAQPIQAQPAPKPNAPKPNTQVSRPKTPKPSDTSIFGEVTKDIKMLPATNTTRQADYEQALAVIERFDEIVAQKVAAGEDEIVFSESEVEGLQKAVSEIDAIADEGNTSAILSMALCYFKGVGQPQDLGKGVEMVFKAAERQDMRAQKFLSRLYYQGVGVEQSTHNGELWLAKAAESGHPEARRIQQQLMQIKAMKDDFKVEAKKDKNYLILIGAVVVIVILALYALAKLAN